MFTRWKGSLVDPKRPTQSNWLGSYPSLVGFSNGGNPRSSASTTVSSVFDKRATGSTFSTIDSLPSANESRSSTASIDDVPSTITSSRHKGRRTWDALVHKILRKNIQDSDREVRTGNGVQFTLDLNDRDEVKGSNLKVLVRHHVETQAQKYENSSSPPSHSKSQSPRVLIESQHDLKDEPQQQTSESGAIPDAYNAATLPELKMSSISRFRGAASPTLSTPESSPRRHKRGSGNHSISTMQSITSEEKLKQKPWGEDILVCTEYSKEKDERLFAWLDCASNRSWISFEALKILGVSDEVGTDGMGIQPLSDKETETWTIGGNVKAYGKIKLSFRGVAGPMSTKRYKFWFNVADHSDTPFQILLGRDFPDLQTEIANLSLVTIPHPKNKAQKAEDAARAKKHKERKQRLEAAKAGSSHTTDLPDIPSDYSVQPESGDAPTGAQ